MNSLVHARFLAAAALAVGALGAASVAHAGSDVYFSIGFQGPVYVEPAPVYVQPRPVYVQPRPVYVQPQPVYVQPQPVYVQPQPVYSQAPVYVQSQQTYPYSYDDGRQRQEGRALRYDEWRRSQWRKHHHHGWKHRDRDDDDRDSHRGWDD